MLGLNAADVYDFDVGLGELAAEIGPTPEELGQVDDAANRAEWAAAAKGGRFWLTGMEVAPAPVREAVATSAREDIEMKDWPGRSRSSPAVPVASARRSAALRSGGHEGGAADLDRERSTRRSRSCGAQSFDVTGVLVDVTKRESVEELRDATLDAYGAVHVAVQQRRHRHDRHRQRVGARERRLAMVARGPPLRRDQRVRDVRAVDARERRGVAHRQHGVGQRRHRPDAETPPYALAKASIVTYTECLWAQLRTADSKIGVSLLFPSGYTPGLLNTGIWNERVRPPGYEPRRRGRCAAAWRRSSSS